MSATVGSTRPAPMKTAEGTPAARQTQRVIVTKRVHGSSALDPTLTTDAQDPTALQLNDRGDIVPHSILGTKEEFVAACGYDPTPAAAAAANRRASIQEEARRRVSGIDRAVHPTQVWEDEKEGRQLQQWATAGRDWERQEAVLAKKLGREPTQLMMNSEAVYRRVKERREKLDIALSDPSAMRSNEKGKGYRVGTEYWAQPLVTKSGLQSTLTKRERGDVAASDTFEYIGKPSTVLRELHQAGRPVGSALDRTIPFFHAPYLEDRQAELDSAIGELFEHEPDLDGLEVVGTAIHPPVQHSPQKADPEAERVAAEAIARSMASGLLIAGAQSALPPAEEHNERQSRVRVQPGPHLAVIGTDDVREGEARVHFHAAVGSAASASLVLENRGTTALILAWRKVEAPNPLGKVEDNAQRFYFDHRPVTILPGERRSLPVQFRTRVGGMFLETWAASVLPSVGLDTEVIFCGTATREDEFRPVRDAMEAALEKALITRAIKDMLHALITRIHPRNHEAIFGAPPPTLEERFTSANTELVAREGWTYGDRIVRDLQTLHRRVTCQLWAATNVPAAQSTEESADAKGAKKEETPVEVSIPEPEEWDLSVAGLKETIMDLPDWELPGKVQGHTWLRTHEYLDELNLHVMALTRMKARDIHVDRRSVAREFISAMISGVEAKCIQARLVCGVNPMPIVAAEDVPEEEYVPRIQISPPVKGAKKPTKPPPKDDKKKKPERQGQGVPPEPLDEATATALAPIQFAMAREAVVSALDDLETLFPLCE